MLNIFTASYGKGLKELKQILFAGTKTLKQWIKTLVSRHPGVQIEDLLGIDFPPRTVA